ncbi:unnamed protein product [Caretta caretta]
MEMPRLSASEELTLEWPTPPPFGRPLFPTIIWLPSRSPSVQRDRGPAYWHFNNSLLEDESFVMSFREFWLAWREQWRAFPSVRRWWDLGKVRAKLFCRNYTRGTSRRRNAAIEQLEREVLELERRLAASPGDPSLCGACREKREGTSSPRGPPGPRRAVLALLPKKGDLRDLRNWRPLSLLSTDYKIVAKAISLRLGSVMADVIHPDQTYTVPGRSIFDNLFLVRDLLELGRRGAVCRSPSLSLDQEKAFDRVDHGYLLSTLRAFGFGPQFVSFLRVLYASAECLVRLNWTLTEPVSFGRGVRQGCPLSGQLYALAIEPFLCLLRRRLTGLVLREPELRLVLSAYADDVLPRGPGPGRLGASGGMPNHLFGSLLRPSQLGQELWLGGGGLAAEGPGPAYWHFNNSLLEDESFVMSFREFWLAWREQWRAFPSVRRWWDLGKVRAKLFCRNYTRGTSRRRNAAIEQLEREVLELERRLAASPGDPSLCGACREKREELRALEDHRARAEDGTPLTDPEEMCGRARDFYANLFSPDPTDPGACGVLWEELPTVSVGDRDRLELPLTLAEFSEALRRMPTNKSPGMDGLTVEFYRAFWDILGPDLVTVWAESLQGGVLPLSCRRAVLALLPKKGDLRDLRNWRPLSLLSTDYKIVAKAISLRLGSSETFWNSGGESGLSFALLSLDQEKAFDRVDHGYLLSTLRAFGFGPQFVSFLRVLYASAECLVRLNWTLTEPVSFGRGVRQGCPLSGQLYALAIEPFLCLLRRRLTGLVLREPELRLVLSAYADDVLLVVQDPGDLARVEACQTIFSAASSARVNWVKSSGLAVGGWRQQVSEFLDTLDSHECLILGGDFNTTLEERDRSGAEPSPAAATILRDIVDYHSLVDVWRPLLHHSAGPFSDHHLVAVTVSLRAEGPGPAYWHFNNSLLEDESFVMSFREFWLAWREQWRAFPSVRRWWDLGKVRAKLFCRNYTRGTSRRRNAAIEQLEREVLELERRLAASPGDPSLCGACREKREELRALEDHRARGAFVRSRIRLLREMDRGSRFFYALEKTRGGQKHVTCLLAEDGTPPHGSGGDVWEGP